jgi:beta-lactamase superfamily II metal-dependent hydrolase
VGHGDCVIVENFDTSRTTVIDINRTKEMDKNSKKEVYESFKGLASYINDTAILQKESISTLQLEEKGYDIKLTDPIEYIEGNNITEFHRFISTHPHMDHISGIKALQGDIGFINVWISSHTWSPDISKLTESQKDDWDFYQSLKKGEVESVKTINPLENDKRKYILDDGFSILAPNQDILDQSDANANNISYVLLLEYADRKIVFGGDAERLTWEHVLQNHSSEIKNIDILKASHHGRDSGYHQPSVKTMDPSYIIVSVGKKPSTDSSNKYRAYSDNVWSTRWKGNIVFTIESDGSITYSFEYDR